MISTPVLPFFVTEFGAGPAAIGWTFAAWTCMSTFCAPLLVILSDRIGRKTVLVISLFGGGAAILCQGFAPSLFCLVAARALSGAWAASGTTAKVYVVDMAPPATVADYLSTLAGIPPLALCLGQVSVV